jgi:ribose 1,5-bisphosphokinase PhnN
LARTLTTTRPHRFAQPVGTTTRPPRSDDQLEYRHVRESQFMNLHDANGFFAHDEYAGFRYGFATSDIERVRATGRLPILTLTPPAAREKVTGGGWLVVWVDARDDELDQRLAARGQLNLAQERVRRGQDRSVAGAFTHRLDNSGRLETTLDALERLLRTVDAEETRS